MVLTRLNNVIIQLLITVQQIQSYFKYMLSHNEREAGQTNNSKIQTKTSKIRASSECLCTKSLEYSGFV